MSRSPFGGQLPPGWNYIRVSENIYLVINEKGEVVTEALIDNTIPAKAQLIYIWKRYHQEVKVG